MKRGFLFCIIIAGCLLMSSASASDASPIIIAENIENAFIAKKPCPLASQQIDGLTVDQAYGIQAELVKLRENKGEIVMGYKAGLTAAPAQKRFGVNEAVRGTLFKSMLRWPGTMYKKNFAHMFIETEIGFRFGRDITEPVQDAKSLKKAVAIVFPAIELPDLSYTDMKQIKGVDIIASNVAARKVLIGKAVAVTAKDLNKVTVNLFLNGKEIDTGAGKNALGDQWEALKWTVNSVLSRGGEVKCGHIVITGSLTRLMPAKPGRYLADYGDFGKIEFEFK